MERRHVIVLVKVAIAAALIAWLVRSGTLDFGALGIYFAQPALLVGNIVMFAVTYLLWAVRWRLLLKIADVDLGFGRAVQLTLTSAFFNVVAPGNIGGDVLKAVYVARDRPPALRPRVYLVGFLDRLLALAGLVAVAVILNLWTRIVSNDSPLGEPTVAIVILAAVTIVMPALGLLIVRRFARGGASTSTSRFVKLFERFVGAARLVSARPGALVLGLVISMLIQVCGIVWFSIVTSAVLDQHVSVGQMAAVYPLGMLSLLLPISYAGFGVGHIAFEKLFVMVGLTHGANVVNVYLIGQLVLALFGVIPYLLLKREAAPSVAEVSAASSG
jgi:uncharacterized protein (TIRG00374 family)